MFPFKAKQFVFELHLSAEDLYVRGCNYSKKWKCISIKDGQYHGVVRCNQMLFELGELFFKNSFRPIAVFDWKNVNGKAIITGYYRIQMGVIWLSFILPITGIVQAFRYHTLAPVIFFCLLWIILQMLFYLLFMKDFDWFQANFKDIINGEFPQNY
jgi:hypothetical protein